MKKTYALMWERIERDPKLANRGVCRQTFEDPDEAMMQAQKVSKGKPDMKYWVEELLVYPPLEQK